MKRGFFIPAEIWEDESLSLQEKVLLAKIAEFEKNGKPCFLSNAAIADLLGLKYSQAREILYSLIRRGVLERDGFDGKKRTIRLVQTVGKSAGSMPENRQAACRKIGRQSAGNPTHNSSNITSTPTESLLKEKTTTSSTPAFVPPSIEMVFDYIKDMGMRDPEGFARYYVESQTANGWTRRERNKMVPVKDWKNNVRQWIPNHMNHTFPKPVPAPAAAPVTKSEERLFTKADLTTGVLPADMPREMRQYIAFGGAAKFANDTWIKI